MMSSDYLTIKGNNIFPTEKAINKLSVFKNNKDKANEMLFGSTISNVIFLIYDIDNFSFQNAMFDCEMIGGKILDAKVLNNYNQPKKSRVMYIIDVEYNELPGFQNFSGATASITHQINEIIKDLSE